jgi:hypothetical protein
MPALVQDDGQRAPGRIVRIQPAAQLCSTALARGVFRLQGCQRLLRSGSSGGVTLRLPPGTLQVGVLSGQLVQLSCQEGHSTHQLRDVVGESTLCEQLRTGLKRRGKMNSRGEQGCKGDHISAPYGRYCQGSCCPLIADGSEG